VRLADATELTRASKEPIASLEKSIVVGWELLSCLKCLLRCTATVCGRSGADVRSNGSNVPCVYRQGKVKWTWCLPLYLNVHIS
jgi:hypothetical protein